jgi:hypothetical protein
MKETIVLLELRNLGYSKRAAKKLIKTERQKRNARAVKSLLVNLY